MVRQLGSVGSFIGAQGLIRLLYGLFNGDLSKLFWENFDQTSLKYQCHWGNGPEYTIRGTDCVPTAMWHRGKDIKDALRWLVGTLKIAMRDCFAESHRFSLTD